MWGSMISSGGLSVGEGEVACGARGGAGSGFVKVILWILEFLLIFPNYLGPYHVYK